MATIEHKDATLGELHGVINWIFESYAQRDAEVLGFKDTGKICEVSGSFYIVDSQLQWIKLADGGINVKGRVPNYAALPLTNLTPGDSFFNDADGLIYIWSGLDYQIEGSGFASGLGSVQTITGTVTSGSLTIPAQASVWFQVSVGSDKYAIPGFLITP